MKIKKILKSWQSYEERAELFDKIGETSLQEICNSELCKTEGCILEDNIKHAKDLNYVMKSAVTGSMPLEFKNGKIIFPLPSCKYCHIQSYLTDELDEDSTVYRWGTVTYVPRTWKWSYAIEMELNPTEAKQVKELNALEADYYLGIREINDRLFAETKAKASATFSMMGLAEFEKFLKEYKES